MEKSKMFWKLSMGVTALLAANFCSLSIQAQSPADQEVKKVHVIFKTHLDVGFTDLGSNTLRTYMTEFVPAALSLSERLKDEQEGVRYPWTTGSLLLWDYLDQSRGGRSKRMEEAIGRGDFFWHALPFTGQFELCDSALFAASFFLSHDLDKRFGHKTVAAKITDVPGLTINAVPVMVRNGVELLHIGTNPCAAHPDVPEIFRWQHADGSVVNVVYQTGYGEYLRIPSTDIAAYICFTGDNHGPHPVEKIKEIYAEARKRFPNAEVTGSSLDALAEDIKKVESSLPVVRGEIGDTWIYGVASDPKKIAEFRTLMRMRNEWLRHGKLERGSEADKRFSKVLLMVTEHTWGLDVKSFLHHWDKYAPEDFIPFQSSPECKHMERSWQEKSAFIAEAIGCLPAALQREAYAALEELTPKTPVLDGFQAFDPAKKTLKTAWGTIGFDPATGSVSRLETKSGKTWASAANPLGLFCYQTLSERTFNEFIKSYCPPNPPLWAWQDYGKQGMAAAGFRDTVYTYRTEQSYLKKTKEKTEVVFCLSVDSSRATYGAPRQVVLEYVVHEKEAKVEVAVSWFGKAKNRITEALWFSFVPSLDESGKVMVEKMNGLVDPRTVVSRGSRKQHAIGDYLFFSDKGGAFYVHSADAPLAVFNGLELMAFDDHTVDARQGVGFCLFNNAWGTNYPQWTGDDMRFRFVMELKD